MSFIDNKYRNDAVSVRLIMDKKNIKEGVSLTQCDVLYVVVAGASIH